MKYLNTGKSTHMFLLHSIKENISVKVKGLHVHTTHSYGAAVKWYSSTYSKSRLEASGQHHATENLPSHTGLCAHR
jgi:hypothetical protein